MAESDPDPFTLVLADVLTGEPSLADRLLAVHVPDDSGRCAGCGGLVPQPWPCAIRWHVDRAIEIRHGRRG